MLRKTTKTIHDLKIFFLVFILFSFLHTVGVNPFDATKYLGARFTSAVGMSSSASVPPNPINSLALQLQEKESRLDQWESDLSKRETKIESSAYITNSKVM